MISPCVYDGYTRYARVSSVKLVEQLFCVCHWVLRLDFMSSIRPSTHEILPSKIEREKKNCCLLTVKTNFELNTLIDSVHFNKCEWNWCNYTIECANASDTAIQKKKKRENRNKKMSSLNNFAWRLWHINKDAWKYKKK